MVLLVLCHLAICCNFASTGSLGSEKNTTATTAYCQAFLENLRTRTRGCDCDSHCFIARYFVARDSGRGRFYGELQ